MQDVRQKMLYYHNVVIKEWGEVELDFLCWTNRYLFMTSYHWNVEKDVSMQNILKSENILQTGLSICNQSFT